MRQNQRLTSATALFIFLAIAMSIPVSADNTFTIPNYVTDGEEFYACSDIPLDILCMDGTEAISYSYGTSEGYLSKYDSELDVTMDILCTGLQVEHYNIDYPGDSVEISLYNTGYCDIDGINYPITVLASAQTDEVKLSINGYIDWYSLSDTYTIDNSINAKFIVENIRETQYSTYVNISCDSDKIVTNTYTYLYINGSCDHENQVDIIEWSDSKTLDIGDVKINLLSNSTSGYIYGNVSDTITFKLNLLDYNDTVLSGYVDYAVRNSTGDILVKDDMTYDTQMSAYVANYTFDRHAPFGFVEFNAYSPGEGYGGTMYYLKVEPYRFNLTINNSHEINHTYFLKDQIPINISYDNYYGEIISINTTLKIDYDNETSETIDLPLNMTDTSLVYNVPGDAPGNYTLEATVYHSTGENKTYRRNIIVEGFHLNINTDPFWEVGDNITFSAWIEDRRQDMPVIVSSTATFVLTTPSSQNIQLASVNTTDYKQKSNYQTSNTTTMGYYTIKVSSTDIYGHNYYGEYRFSVGGVYSNQFIEVNVPDRFTINTTGNYTVNVTVKNIKGQKIYDMNAHEENETSYIYVNSSEEIDINASESAEIKITITPDNLENGEYEETIHIDVGDDTLEMPLMFDIDLNPEAEVSNRNFNDSAFEIKMFKMITWQEVVTIKNIGYRDMKMPAIHFLGDDMILNVTVIQPASDLEVNDLTNVEIRFNFDTAGTYTGELWITGFNMKDQEYNITITVLEGLSDEVMTLSDNIALAGNKRNILEFNASKNDMNLNFTTLDEMILNATNMRSYILSIYVDPENYETVRDNITQLDSMLSDIEDELEDMEKSYELLIKPKAGDGKCDASESCSSPDCTKEKRCITDDNKNVCGDSVCSVEDNECITCPADCPKAMCEALLNPDTTDDNTNAGGGSILWIVIIVVIVLVVGVILATSLVPDDDNAAPEKDIPKVADVMEKIHNSINNKKS
ncbi:hypothetical protein GQ472_02555 [archaeon]|nr:hypothetical protein [archaeon]